MREHSNPNFIRELYHRINLADKAGNVEKLKLYRVVIVSVSADDITEDDRMKADQYVIRKIAQYDKAWAKYIRKDLV